MKKIINFRKGAWLTLLVAAAIVANCSKSKDEPEVPDSVKTPEHLKTWEIQPVVDTTQTYMAFAVGNASATSAPVTLTNVKADESEVWVDTNNNGIFDGDDVKVTDFSKPVSFTAANGLFTVYGAVKELTATGNALTAADVSGNKQLGKLNVANNQLNEAALQALVKSLPTATDPNAAVVLRNTDDPNEKNVVSDAVLNTAKERGWQALKTERGKEVPDLPMDTEAPKAGTITEATATAFNSALVKWTAATDNKTATEKLRYQVLYNVKGNAEVKTSEVKENILELTLTGLAEKTTYVVKVKVIDEANNATEYDAKEVTTPAAPITADTEAPKAGAITEATATAFNTVLVKWTAATDNKTAAEKLRYQVVYQVKGSDEVKTSELKENMLELTLTGLAEKTTYIIKVKVIDEANNVTEYEAKQVTTPAAPDEKDKEAPKPGYGITSNIGRYGVTISWGEAIDNKTPSDKLIYQVFWQAEGSSKVNQSKKLYNKDSFVLTHLGENITYKVWVVVEDLDGNKATYESITFTTLEIDRIPPEVGEIWVTPAKGKIIIGWTAATDNKTPQEKLRYEIFWERKLSKKIHHSWHWNNNKLEVSISAGENDFYDGDRFAEGEEYEAWVIVEDESYNKSSYKRISFKPYDERAPEVSDKKISISKINFSDVKVHWQKAYDYGTEETKLVYTISLYERGVTEPIFSTPLKGVSSNSHIFKGLKPNTIYTVKVKVRDEGGNVTDYEQATFRTNSNLENSHIEIITKNNYTDFLISATTEEQKKTVWIDLNGNGQWDEGTDIIPETFGGTFKYKTHGTYKVYGEFNEFRTTDSQITSVRIETSYLNELDLQFLKLNSLIIRSSCRELEKINLKSSDISYLSLGNLPKLKEFLAYEATLGSLDFSKCPELKKIVLTEATATEIKPNQNLNEVKAVGFKNTTALIDFINSLPTREASDRGQIWLSNNIKTTSLINTLSAKNWDIQN